jgi:hypothetical protein
MEMKHFCLSKSDPRDTKIMFKEKRERKQKLPLLGLSVSMQLTVVLAYLDTPQSGGNA